MKVKKVFPKRKVKYPVEFGYPVNKITNVTSVCFKDSNNHLIIAGIFQGKLELFEGAIEPIPMQVIDTFDADGISDYNWGVVNVVTKHKLGPRSLLVDCVDIAENGL